jgi:SnoaL-like domain
MKETKAVSVARAHVEAFSNRNYEKAERLLADDVHFTVLTTTPNMETLDNVSIPEFMKALRTFGEAIIPGTSSILEEWGDQTRALLIMSYEAAWGADGKRIKLIGARHYLLNDTGKIQAEKVIFFPLAD